LSKKVKVLNPKKSVNQRNLPSAICLRLSALRYGSGFAYGCGKIPHIAAANLGVRVYAEFDVGIRLAKNGELIGLILTAKPHDGFWLWPSAFTTTR